MSKRKIFYKQGNGKYTFVTRVSERVYRETLKQDIKRAEKDLNEIIKSEKKEERIRLNKAKANDIAEEKRAAERRAFQKYSGLSYYNAQWHGEVGQEVLILPFYKRFLLGVSSLLLLPFTGWVLYLSFEKSWIIIVTVVITLVSFELYLPIFTRKARIKRLKTIKSKYIK